MVEDKPSRNGMIDQLLADRAALDVVFVPPSGELGALPAQFLDEFIKSRVAGVTSRVDPKVL